RNPGHLYLGPRRTSLLCVDMAPPRRTLPLFPIPTSPEPHIRRAGRLPCAERHAQLHARQLETRLLFGWNFGLRGRTARGKAGVAARWPSAASVQYGLGWTGARRAKPRGGFHTLRAERPPSWPFPIGIGSSATTPAPCSLVWRHRPSRFESSAGSR